MVLIILYIYLGKFMNYMTKGLITFQLFIKLTMFKTVSSFEFIYRILLQLQIFSFQFNSPFSLSMADEFTESTFNPLRKLLKCVAQIPACIIPEKYDMKCQFAHVLVN